MTGRIVIVSGPSGVGKDTVIDAWQILNPSVRRVVAATTRAPRDGEVDGDDYFFLSHKNFEKLIDADAFVEYKQVHSNLYGTPKSSIEGLLADGLTALLKIDVQGAEVVIDKIPSVCSIFLMPPSMEELERRIRGRGTESESKIQERLENARMEIDMSRIYGHRVVNGDLGSCVQEIDAIVEAHYG